MTELTFLTEIADERKGDHACAFNGFLEDYLGVRMLAPDAEYVPVMKVISLNPINDIQIPPATIRIVNGPFASDTSYKYFRKAY